MIDELSYKLNCLEKRKIRVDNLIMDYKNRLNRISVKGGDKGWDLEEDLEKRIMHHQ